MNTPLRAEHRVNAAKIAERLIAHARLCRPIAKQSWSEADARKLETLADECLRAGRADAGRDRQDRPHATLKACKKSLEPVSRNGTEKFQVVGMEPDFLPGKWLTKTFQHRA